MFWLINHKFVSHFSSSKSVVETKLEQKKEDGDINVLGLASSFFIIAIFYLHYETDLILNMYHL